MVDMVGTLTEDRPNVSSLWLEGRIIDMAELGTKTMDTSDDKKTSAESLPSSLQSLLSVMAVHIKTPEPLGIGHQRRVSTSHRGSFMRLRRATFGAISKAEIKKARKVENDDYLRVRGASDNGGGIHNPNVLRIQCGESEKQQVELKMSTLEHKEGIEHPGIAHAFEGKADKVAAENSIPRRKILSPLDAALTEFIKKFKPIGQFLDDVDVVYETPFSDSRRCQLIVIQQNSGTHEEEAEENHYQLMVKGTPEDVIKSCATIISSNGTAVPIDDDQLIEFEALAPLLLLNKR